MNSDFRDILSAFCEEKVEFMLVGAYAVAAHGLARATGDIDLWIKCSDGNAERVWRALDKFGSPLQDLSKSDLTMPGIVIQLGVVPRRVDILTEITGVTFEEAEANHITLELEGLKVPVIGRAHLIKNKRAVGRPQDMADVARLESN
ncbi:MAG: hypothetical protein ACREBC_14055 [Pyrinomonadaceae bacterium]